MYRDTENLGEHIKSLMDARLGEKDRNYAHFAKTGRNSIVNFFVVFF